MKIFNRIILFAAYLIVILAIFAALDVFVFNRMLGYGSSRLHHNLTDVSTKVDYPYIGFAEKQIAAAEPYSMYYTGRKLYQNNENKIRIAFFGGSTGAYGDPDTPDSLTIPEYLEQLLKERLKKDVVVINYSCGGAHHRQHLHMLPEFMPKFKPDIVLFYGGNNETVQAFGDDPRFSYPFNYFYKAEVQTWKKLFFEYSAIGGILYDRYFEADILQKLRSRVKFRSPEWQQKMIDNYIDTLELSNKITKTFKSDIFGSAVFIAVFQPLNLSFGPEWTEPVEGIRKKLPELKYTYDFFHKYDNLPDNIWHDSCQVRDEANRFMASEIADLLTEKYLKKYKK